MKTHKINLFLIKEPKIRGREFVLCNFIPKKSSRYGCWWFPSDNKFSFSSKPEEIFVENIQKELGVVLDYGQGVNIFTGETFTMEDVEDIFK